MNHQDPIQHRLTQRSAPLGTVIATLGLIALLGRCHDNPYLATLFAILILFMVLFLALSLYRLNLNYARHLRRLRTRIRLMHRETALFRTLMADTTPSDSEPR